MSDIPVSDPYSSDPYTVTFFPAEPTSRLPLFFAIDDEDAVQISLLLQDERKMQIGADRDWSRNTLPESGSSRGQYS